MSDMAKSLDKVPALVGDPADENAIVAQLRALSGPQSSTIDEHITLMAMLADLASAGEKSHVDHVLSRLEELRDGDQAASVACDFFLSHLALRHEEYERAAKHCGRGHGLALELGWEAEAAGFCIVLGTVKHKLGDYALARRNFEEAVVAARRAGSDQLEGRAAMNLGLVLKNLGDFREAERLLRFALSVSATPTNEARCALNLTTVLIRKGALAEALELATSSSKTFESLNLRGLAVTSNLARARATRLLGDAAEARIQLESALEEARRIEKPRNVILALEFLGDCELDLGNASTAREHYREALLLARGHGKATDLVLECLRGLGAADLACGEPQTARESVEESIQIARDQGDTFELATSLLVLASALAALDEPAAVRDALEEARALSVAIGAEHIATESAARLAQHDSMAGRAPEMDQPAATPSRRPMVVEETGIEGFLTVDPRVLRTIGTVRKLAPRRLNIVIHGESGTGKELIARALHDQSERRGPFVPVNCSAFPGDLIEGELFGHARGAYTGADRERVGLFEHAHKGTLFLDEIGDMPIKAQARLLRALEGGEVRRLGENTARVVDVRVVAATHRDLMTMVGAGEFRLDLYYRLAGYVVELPPVRERVEDAKLLVDHYLARFAKEQGKSISMTAELRQELAGHSWPGNVREIRLVLDRLVSLSEDGAVLRRLPFALEGDPRPRSLPEMMEAEEKRRILDALQTHNWNKQRAATTLGTNRTTLIGKMKRMGIAIRKS